MTEQKFKWASPYEWLADKTKDTDKTTIRQDMLAFAMQVGNDGIKEMYHAEMNNDGYFDPLPSPPPQDVVDRAKAIARAFKPIVRDIWVRFDPNWSLQLTQEDASDPVEATLYQIMEDGTSDVENPYPVVADCEACDNAGFLLGNVEGKGHMEIQKCDACDVFPYDNEATIKAFELAKAQIAAKKRETP